MENIFEIVTIKSLSDNYIWLLRNNLKNLTAVIDPSDDKDVNEVLLLKNWHLNQIVNTCLLYTSPSPRDRTRSRMPSSA